MNYILFTTLLCLGLCLGMLLMQEIGRRNAIHRWARDPEGAKNRYGTSEGAVLGLLGLLLAFTVTGASTRFDLRRGLVVEETNAIGTAYLRLDVLPDGVQPAMRENFRRYLDARIALYRNVRDTGAIREDLDRVARLQQEIWRQAVDGVRREGAPPQATVVLLPALNAMFDITTTRTWATQMHPPAVIFIMLFALALTSALMSGYGMAGDRSRSWLHMLSFAFIISITIYVILDLEYPRLGLIRVDAFDQALVDLRNTMN